MSRTRDDAFGSFFEKNFVEKFVAMIGVFLLVVAFVGVVDTQALLNKSVVTKGVIVDLRIWSKHGGKTLGFRFVDRTYKEFTCPISWRFRADLSIGQEVEIFYDPENPYNAKINDFWQIWGFQIVFAILGSSLLLLGFFGLWRARAREVSQTQAGKGACESQQSLHILSSPMLHSPQTRSSHSTHI